MRPANVHARERLRQVLAAGPRTTAELVARLEVSGASLHRMLVESRDDVVSSGNTRRRRHALRRALRGVVADIPVFAIDANGSIAPAGQLVPIQPAGCLAQLQPEVWPVLPTQGGWWDGLPYPVYDMRPQGYLGRSAARAMPATLHLPDNPDRWSDDDILVYLTQYGSDTAGHLIVGEHAMQRHAQSRAGAPNAVIAASDVPRRYVELAEAAVQGGDPGSSAGGEFPKFTAAREAQGAQTPHVIVKFSGSDDSPAVRRWSDLLVCEQLALQTFPLPARSAARLRRCDAGFASMRRTPANAKG